MRLIQDLAGQWVGQPAFSGKIPGNLPPVALNDTAVAEADGPAILIQVLGNDVDPEGGALTLVSAYAALGTASAEPDGRVRYTPPPGFSGPDTVVYTVADAAGQTDTGQVNITVLAPALAVEMTSDSRIEVTAATGGIVIEVTEPAEFAGTYSADLADLPGGPVNLVPPRVSGLAEAGGTLTAISGLWLYGAGEVPVRSWSWTRDGQPIAGAETASYAVVPTDAGATLAAVEILGDGFGTRSIGSAGITVGFQPTSDPGLSGWWDADDAATVTAAAETVSSWANKAGGSPLTQITPGVQPRTGTRMLNGRNLLDFTEAEFLIASLQLPASGDFAIHMVAEIDSVSNEYAALIAVDATNDFQIDAGSAAQFDGRLNVAGIGTTATFAGGPFSGALILSAIFDRSGTGTAQIFVSGTPRASIALTAAVDAAAALHLMTNRSRNAGVDGGIGELVITTDVSNRAAYHAYLAAKWGQN